MEPPPADRVCSARRNPLKQGNQTVRLKPKWTVRLWVASVGVAMAAWLAGLAMAAIWMVELALS